MYVKVSSHPFIQSIEFNDAAFELAIVDGIGLGSKKLNHAQWYVSLSCEFHAVVCFLVVKKYILLFNFEDFKKDWK